MKFAVIQTGGKQYLIKPGDIIKVEKVDPAEIDSSGVKKPKKEGELLYFNEVLLAADGDKVQIGKPFLKNVKVSAEWLKEGKAKKISILRYKSKTRQTRKKGHRQMFTEVKIKEIKS